MAEAMLLFFKNIEVFWSVRTSLSNKKFRPELREMTSKTCFNATSLNSMVMGLL